MCVSCSANKCRIRESDLQAARLYIIFLNWYYAELRTIYAELRTIYAELRTIYAELRTINE